MINWRDSDGRGRTFSAHFGRLRVIVTRHIHYAPDEWLASCEPFFSERSIARGAELEKAQRMAIELLKHHIDAVRAAL